MAERLIWRRQVLNSGVSPIQQLVAANQANGGFADNDKSEQGGRDNCGHAPAFGRALSHGARLLVIP